MYGFDYALKEYNLYNDQDDYNAQLGQVFTMEVIDMGTKEAYRSEWTAAWLNYEYGTYMKSNEPICFIGDIFPAISPSCGLKLDYMPVSTMIHNPH